MKIRVGLLWCILVVAFTGCVTVERFHEGMFQAYSRKYPWLRPHVYQICVREAAAVELPVNLVLAVIDAESGGNSMALNPKSGARGLMQVMAVHWYPGHPEDLFLPEIGVRHGCRALKWAHGLARGNLVLTLRNYERGPRGQGINWPYTFKILSNLNETERI